MGSSAQNSSGVHWCRRRVRFKEVSEKVPKVPIKVWEALVQSQVKFNRVPEKVLEKVWEALVQNQEQGFREGSGEGLGVFGAEPGQGLGEGSGEGLGGFWCRARSGSTGVTRVPETVPEKVPGSLGAKPSPEKVPRFRRRSGRLLVQSQVKFNRVPEKVPEKVWEALV